MPQPSRTHIFFAIFSLIAGGILGATLYAKNISEAQSVTPPQISKVTVTDLQASSTLINWTTDSNSDSVVTFGISKGLGTAKDPNPSATTHQVILPDLEPATAYFFRVSSADAVGNRSFSATYQFTTPGTQPIPGLSAIQNADQRLLTEKVSEILSKVTDPKALEIIAQKVQAQGEAELTPPRILGEPHIDVATDQATLSWDTDKEANSVINFAAEGQYQSGGSYSRTEGDAGNYTMKHAVTLYGLTPSTVYHFQISSKPSVGPEAHTDDLTFITKSILPQIFGIHLQKVEQDSATLVWSTQVPAGALVEYTNLGTKETKSIGDPSFQLTHTIRLPDLKFRSPYEAVIKARTQSGDEIAGQPVRFTTTKDDTPPIISNVANESTLYPGTDVKVQTIVSWDTDELSACQLFYGEGLAVSAENAQSLSIETGFELKHTQVITEFAPSTVYKFWVECRDRNENKSKSEDFVLFTPDQQKSIIDIILENFQGTFGWIKNIGK